MHLPRGLSLGSNVPRWPPGGPADRTPVVVALQLVRAEVRRVVAKAVDRRAAEQVALDDLARVGRRDRGIPDSLGVDDDHRSIAALAEAAGVVDPHAPGQVGGADGRFERRVDAQAVTVHGGAPLPAGADEDVSLVDGHSRKYPCRRIESTGAPQPTPTLLSGQKPRVPHLKGPRVLQQHWEAEFRWSATR